MKKGMVIFICVAFLPYMTGCGASGENKMAASIYDGQTETRLDVRKGITVRKILEEAEIIINNEDTVVPSLDTKVTGEKMDISIKRNRDINLFILSFFNPKRNLIRCKKEILHAQR